MNKIVIIYLGLLCLFPICEGKIKMSSNTIEVVKFMYLDNYPMAIDTKSFWKFPNEHARFILPLGRKTFLDEVKTLQRNNCDSLTFINYAFVIKKKSTLNDTVYADFTLKTWIFKENKKSVNCYYDEKGTYSEFLRENYPFFKDCW